MILLVRRHHLAVVVCTLRLVCSTEHCPVHAVTIRIVWSGPSIVVCHSHMPAPVPMQPVRPSALHCKGFDLTLIWNCGKSAPRIAIRRREQASGSKPSDYRRFGASTLLNGCPGKASTLQARAQVPDSALKLS
jgi:hypothetical protein